MNITVKNIKNGLKGTITIPPDKSISHRAVMFSALTGGKTKITNFSKGADCISTLNIIQQLGCDVKFIDENNLIIIAPNKLITPTQVLNCGNSGTTMRLISGILATQNFESTLIGDASLSKRPMKRIIEPLELMGAQICHNDYRAPLKIFGKKLQPINYKSKLASAQVKSCILLAGLNTYGETKVTEPYVSRDHTERMLKYLGADIVCEGVTTKIKKSKLEPKSLKVCSKRLFRRTEIRISGLEVWR